MSSITLLDLITLQKNDPLTGLVEDVTTYAPEVSSIPVVTRPGITYYIAKRNALPTSGFRQVNAGIASSKSSFKKEVKEMFPIDCQITVDEMIVKGDDRSIGDILSIEAQGALQSTLITVGSQTYYGTDNDANGFTGLRAQMYGTASAGGTTNSTTAYALWLNPHGVSYDIGKDGVIAMPPFSRQQIPAPNGSGNIFAWVSNISFYIGLSVKSNYSVWGVTGITDHTVETTSSAFVNGQNTVYDQAMTDRNAASLVAQIPLVRRNGLTWFMNRKAHFLLQQSRAAINFQSAGAFNASPAWSSRPETCEGFPIVVTDSITNTENNS